MRAIVTLALGLLIVCSAEASAQTWQPPSESQRCPSKWGAGDERGSGNHMKPETVLRAARLIKTGEVFELGQVLSESMPLPGGTAIRDSSPSAAEEGSRYQPARLQ